MEQGRMRRAKHVTSFHRTIWRESHHKARWKRSYGKAIRGGPQGCETSRLPHFLDNRLTNGGEVVSLTLRPPFTLKKIPGTHFCLRLSRSQGHSVAGRIGSTDKDNNLISNRTHDLPACSIVPQSTTLTHGQY
jgi:hypothetical protein